MKFLRALGRDLPLQLVFSTYSSNEDNSTSSDASSQSAPDEEFEQIMKFAVAKNLCLNQLMFDRKGIPDSFLLQGLSPAIQQVATMLKFPGLPLQGQIIISTQNLDDQCAVA